MSSLCPGQFPSRLPPAQTLFQDNLVCWAGSITGNCLTHSVIGTVVLLYGQFFYAMLMNEL